MGWMPGQFGSLRVGAFFRAAGACSIAGTLIVSPGAAGRTTDAASRIRLQSIQCTVP
jgi:hypothetical protein